MKPLYRLAMALIAVAILLLTVGWNTPPKTTPKGMPTPWTSTPLPHSTKPYHTPTPTADTTKPYPSTGTTSPSKACLPSKPATLPVQKPGTLPCGPTLGTTTPADTAPNPSTSTSTPELKPPTNGTTLVAGAPCVVSCEPANPSNPGLPNTGPGNTLLEIVVALALGAAGVWLLVLGRRRPARAH